MKTCLHSLRLLLGLTLITGLLYPLAVWAVGQTFFHAAAEGSLLARDGHLIGSALLAQKTTDPRYFWPRPSAGDYATIASGASNLAWSSARLTATVAECRARCGGGPEVPADLLTASGSGLDPDLSPAAIRAQVSRIGAARNLTVAQAVTLNELIARLTKGGQLSPARINVLRLNLALDATLPSP